LQVLEQVRAQSLETGTELAQVVEGQEKGEPGGETGIHQTEPSCQ
jgi:hypothetical protein